MQSCYLFSIHNRTFFLSYSTFGLLYYAIFNRRLILPVDKTMINVTKVYIDLYPHYLFYLVYFLVYFTKYIQNSRVMLILVQCLREFVLKQACLNIVFQVYIKSLNCFEIFLLHMKSIFNFIWDYEWVLLNL